MKTIEIFPTGSKIDCVTGAPIASQRLVELLGLPMACGGNGICATCHVLVVEGLENLSPIEAKEDRCLGRLTGRLPGSRLSCQARVLGDVSVRMPDGIYLQSIDQLRELIGRRAERNILHPLDGRVLVSAGQVISRFIVRTLEQTGFTDWTKIAESSTDADSGTIV
jgi:2Fe-2S ferredoxin